MIPFGTAHLLYLLFSLVFIASGSLIIARVNRTWQNIIFILTALLGAGGIFFRYAMNLRLTADFQWMTLGIQMLQVCNFNFIVLPLALIKRNEYVRQYAFYFAMLAAGTTFFSYSSSISARRWDDLVVVNFWLNHLAAVALPIFLVASRRFKPHKKYIIPVLIGVFIYFSCSAIGSWLLMKHQGYTPKQTFSFVFYPDGIGIFELLYRMIPIPFVYLWPLMIPIGLVYYGLARIFSGYRVNDF